MQVLVSFSQEDSPSIHSVSCMGTLFKAWKVVIHKTLGKHPHAIESCMQIEAAMPAEPSHVRDFMDRAITFVRDNREWRSIDSEESNIPEEAGLASDSDEQQSFVAQMAPDASGTPSDIPFQSFTTGDVVVGRIVLDARDFDARCVGMAAVSEGAWQELFTRVLAASNPEPPSPLYGTLGATWLNTVKDAALVSGGSIDAGVISVVALCWLHGLSG